MTNFHGDKAKKNQKIKKKFKMADSKKGHFSTVNSQCFFVKILRIDRVEK